MLIYGYFRIFRAINLFLTFDNSVLIFAKLLKLSNNSQSEYLVSNSLWPKDNLLILRKFNLNMQKVRVNLVVLDIYFYCYFCF